MQRPKRRPPRSMLIVVLSLTTFTACTPSDPTPQRSASGDSEVQSGATPSPTGVANGRYARIACHLPSSLLDRLRNGYAPGRSGDIQFVVRPPHFLQGYSHAGPYEHLQRVPLFLFGPGHVPATGVVRRPVTLTSLAPTLAAYLGYEFDTSDGDPLTEAVLTAGGPPRLVMVVVWDAAGNGVLQTHRSAWTAVRRLIPEGAWFESATVGTAPSMTPPVHATIGTGVYPRSHGIVDFVQRDGETMIGAIGSGPPSLFVPTLADLYDRDRGNEPIVGLLGWEPTLGMLGHGSWLEGGDRDLALTTKRGEWGLSPENRPYFHLPAYVEAIPGPEREAAVVDGEDGRLDGLWFGQPLASPLDIEYSPAYSGYQTRVLEELIRREGFGRDNVPDLLFTNYKQIDRIAHVWSFPSQQMSEVVAALGDELIELIGILDREVGEGEWVLAMTADHGATPLASETGGFEIDRSELAADLLAAVDGDKDRRSAIRRFPDTQLWMNVTELEENGHALGDVADFLMGYTIGANASSSAAVPEGRRDVRLFRAVFPGSVLESLRCPSAEA